MKTFEEKEWKKAIQQDENAQIIDVRSTEEYEEGHIPGAELINIEEPQEFVNQISGLDRDKSYYIYCNSGNRGITACQVMNFNGIQKTYNLEGGYQAWEEHNS